MIAINGPQKVITLSTITYTVPSGSGTYLWTVVGGTIIGPVDQNSVNIDWGNSGPGEVTVETTGPIDNGSLVITIFDNITITGDQNVVQGTQEIYTVPNGYDTYAWTVNGGTISGLSDQNSVSIIWDNISSGEVIISTTGPTDSATDNITIFENLTIIGELNINENTSEIYTAPTGYSTYLWTVSGGTINGPSNQNTVTVDWGSPCQGLLSIVTSSPMDICSKNINIIDTLEGVDFNSIIEQIGDMHNEITNEIIQQINFSLSQPIVQKELYNCFYYYNDPSIDLIFKDRSEIMNISSNSEFYLTKNANPEVYQMIINCKKTLFNTPNYSDLLLITQSYRTFANNNFTGIDLQSSLLFLKVTEKSSYYWFPINLGGSGIGSAIFEPQLPPVIYDQINWSKVATADGEGAVTSLLASIYLAAGGPVTWVGIVAAIGWGAGFGSLWNIYNQCCLGW